MGLLMMEAFNYSVCVFVWEIDGFCEGSVTVSTAQDCCGHGSMFLVWKDLKKQWVVFMYQVLVLCSAHSESV